MARILIMEDDKQVCSVFKRTMEDGGHQVQVASDGKTGARMYEKEPADLIIMDIIMPEQEGLETIMNLRRDFPDVKIIAISGGGRISAGDYLKIAHNLGAVVTIEKPIDPQYLLDTVNKIIEEKT